MKTNETIGYFFGAFIGILAGIGVISEGRGWHGVGPLFCMMGFMFIGAFIGVSAMKDNR